MVWNCMSYLLQLVVARQHMRSAVPYATTGCVILDASVWCPDPGQWADGDDWCHSGLAAADVPVGRGEDLVDRPIILVVSEEEATRRTLVGDLRRRLDADYRVLAQASGEAGLDAASRAAAAGEEVALVVVDQGLTSLRPVEVMVRAREIVPTA